MRVLAPARWDWSHLFDVRYLHGVAYHSPGRSAKRRTDGFAREATNSIVQADDPGLRRLKTFCLSARILRAWPKELHEIRCGKVRVGEFSHGYFLNRFRGFLSRLSFIGSICLSRISICSCRSACALVRGARCDNGFCAAPETFRFSQVKNSTVSI